jgi:hypothetical protein
MNLGKLNLITPPDKLFNQNINYLLIKPSTETKIQFEQILSQLIDDINVFIFDENETDLDWMLSVSHQCDAVIIDIDNCDPITKSFVSYLLSFPYVHYLTNDETTPWKFISKNRIYNLDILIQEEEEDDDEEEPNEE